MLLQLFSCFGAFFYVARREFIVCLKNKFYDESCFVKTSYIITAILIIIIILQEWQEGWLLR